MIHSSTDPPSHSSTTNNPRIGSLNCRSLAKLSDPQQCSHFIQFFRDLGYDVLCFQKPLQTYLPHNLCSTLNFSHILPFGPNIVALCHSIPPFSLHPILSPSTNESSHVTYLTSTISFHPNLSSLYMRQLRGPNVHLSSTLFSNYHSFNNTILLPMTYFSSVRIQHFLLC